MVILRFQIFKIQAEQIKNKSLDQWNKEHLQQTSNIVQLLVPYNCEHHIQLSWCRQVENGLFMHGSYILLFFHHRRQNHADIKNIFTYLPVRSLSLLYLIIRTM